MKNNKDKRIKITALIAIGVALAIFAVGLILTKTGAIPEEFEFKVGIVAGLLAGVTIGIAAVVLGRKNNAVSNEFDERQKVAKGYGAQRAFLAMIIVIIGLMVLQLLEIELPIEQTVLYIIIMLVGVTVDVCYNIWHDAYFSLNESKTYTIVLLAIVAAINLVIGIISLVRGDVIQDGKLTANSTNLLASIIFIAALITIALKSIRERRGDDEE